MFTQDFPERLLHIIRYIQVHIELNTALTHLGALNLNHIHQLVSAELRLSEL